jgi:hypothetical protein
MPSKVRGTEGWGKMAEAEICLPRATSIRMGWTPNFELHLNGKLRLGVLLVGRFSR